jgi:peptide/nickel transport system permease protein
VLRYVVNRFAWIFLDLLIILMITFVLSDLLPGDPARAIAGPHASIQTVMAIRHQLGLDRPLYIQFGRYLNNMVHLNLGTSLQFGTPVLQAIWARFPATLELALAGMVFEVLFGIPFGFLAAMYKGSWCDRIIGVISMSWISVPSFWVGMMLLYIAAFKWNLFPLGGYRQPVIYYVILPGITLGLGGCAYYSALIRARLLDLLGKPFVQAARARGLSEANIMLYHVLPNILTTLITQIGMDLGYFMAGVVVVETVFGWPGIGLQAWTGIRMLDVPIIMGTVLFGAFWIIIANCVMDILYATLDPRIRVS